jgi:hypothetical protein
LFFCAVLRFGLLPFLGNALKFLIFFQNLSRDDDSHDVGQNLVCNAEVNGNDQ